MNLPEWQNVFAWHPAIAKMFEDSGIAECFDNDAEPMSKEDTIRRRNEGAMQYELQYHPHDAWVVESKWRSTTIDSLLPGYIVSS